MKNSYLPLSSLFQFLASLLICLRILQCWLYLNASPAKNWEIKADCIIQQRLSVSNKVKYSALLKCSIADKNHGAQQCSNRSIWKIVAILSRDLSVSWLQETCSIFIQNSLYPFKASLAFLKVSKLTRSGYSSNWTKRRLRNLKKKFGFSAHGQLRR